MSEFPSRSEFCGSVGDTVVPTIPTSIVCRYTGQTLTWGMTLEDYEPIKAIGPKPIYYGPNPPAFGQTRWTFPELSRWNWYTITKAMTSIQNALDNNWHKARRTHYIRFYSQMDLISKTGCYYCEYVYPLDEDGYTIDYCQCVNCDGCESKFCPGCSQEDYEE